MSEREALWVKIIKSCYGALGVVKVATLDPSKIVRFGEGLLKWVRIDLEKLGINWFSSFGREMGNGCETSFWEDRWVSGEKLSERFGRLWRVESNKGASVWRRGG